MKTIFRILVILAAAALVGGIIFVLVSTGTAPIPSGFNRQQEGQFRTGDNTEFHHENNASFPPGENENFAPRHEGSRGEFRSEFLHGGIIKGLLIIVVVMIIWLNVGRMFNKVKAA